MKPAFKPAFDPLAIHSGELRHTIDFLYPDYVQGDAGSETVYKHFCTARVKIEPVSGRELMQSGIDTTISYFKITMRFRHGLDDKMRIRYKDAIWRINLIENVLERDRKLIMTCEQFGEDQ